VHADFSVLKVDAYLLLVNPNTYEKIGTNIIELIRELYVEPGAKSGL
jgi:hypothetical protein